MTSRVIRMAVLSAVLTAATGSAFADGMLVPVRPDLRVRGSWAVKYHHVTMTVRDQVAQVQIDQAFVNIGRRAIEVEYLFPVPPGAAITKMTLMADGKELPAKLLKADDARRIYEQIVRTKKDPALLEYVGYGLYKTSVFPLPPGKERRVVITYTVECPKDRDLVKVHYPLNTEKFSAKAIEDVKVVVDIKNRRPIGPVYSPSHDLTVRRKAADHVVATYHVTNAIPSTDFELLYQDGSGDIGATVITHKPAKGKDGWFMALVSPNPRTGRAKPQPKDIVFVIDQSGSMRGKKIAQAKESLTWIFGNLNEGDRFNVVSFSGGVEAMFNVPLVRADAEHVAKAVDLTDRIDASGGTNIDGAMRTAMSLLPDDSSRPAYVLFVTDGKPTVGKTTNVDEIVANAAAANIAKARLLCLGVGYDVNTHLLDLLSKGNRGFSEYVKPNEPLEAKISDLYAKVRNPVMTDLTLTIDGADLRQVYPGELGDLFDGQQIVVVGRYRFGGRHNLIVKGRYGGKQRSFAYPIEMDAFSEDNGAAYLQRVWAMRRIGFLMDQITLHGENDELVDELIALSRDYGIMTPYTSFLAEEDTNLADKFELRKASERNNMAGRMRRKFGWDAQQNARLRSHLSVAVNAPASSAPPAVGGMRGEGTSAGAFLYGAAGKDAYEADRAEALVTVRQVNNITLYRRGRQWSTPDLADAELDVINKEVTTITQFDETYFKLAARNTRDENLVFATQQPGEELLIRLRGRLYRIVADDMK